MKLWGLIGVSIGTLAAMTYQTIWMARYNSKNIINWPFKQFIKQCFVDVITVLIASLATFKIPLLSISYKAWVIQAVEVFACWLVIVCIINYFFYKDKLMYIFNRIKTMVNKSKKGI